MEVVIFDANGGRAYRFSRGHPPVDYLKAFPTSQLIRTSIALFAVGIANGLLTLPAQEEAKDEEATVAAPWTQTNTRLANHYIKLLQKDPAYGDVLDLLWELYRKKDQTPLLIQYFEKASSQGGEIPALLYAHLLRKNDQIDEAREAYDIVLETNEANPHALRALAEIADLQKRFSKALSLYTRLANQVPAAAEEGIALRLRKAALHRMQGQNEKAVEVWNEILDAHPGREDLRTRIVGQLLEAGETDSALQVLQDLVESGDPRLRLEALTSLTRLYEFISDFDGAVESAVKGLALLHYKNHDYADLFSQLVRIHERFDRLPELEEKLRSAVSEENPTEKALYELA
jgi:tetratricopeptide (TPR) repeat protein